MAGSPCAQITEWKCRQTALFTSGWFRRKMKHTTGRQSLLPVSPGERLSILQVDNLFFRLVQEKDEAYYS